MKVKPISKKFLTFYCLPTNDLFNGSNGEEKKPYAIA